MQGNNATLITTFALFSMFFGAGNLILPPFLGLQAAESTLWITLGFALSAVLIPILGIYAHARLQGSILDFAMPVSKGFSLVFCIAVYIIAVSLPAARTAAVTHEIALAPHWEINALHTSSIYFFLVFLFAINRSGLLDVMGKYLTPVILILLCILIGMNLIWPRPPIANPLTGTLGTGNAILEGYQTFDALGAIVVGAVLVVSLNLNSDMDFQAKKRLVARAGLLSGIGLFLVYGGLIWAGAAQQTSYPASALPGRTQLLNDLSVNALGRYGQISLGVLISFACFTTAVGIVTGTADFFSKLFRNQNRAYILAALLASITGVVMGQLPVDQIIIIAVPVLLLIYPVCISLIFLNLLPQHLRKPLVFRAVIGTVLLFSLPEFLTSAGFSKAETLQQSLPLGTYQMGWLLPGMIAFLISVMAKKKAPF